jgi:hypothetical protein
MKELLSKWICIFPGFAIIFIVFITIGCALQQDQTDKIVNSNNSNIVRAAIDLTSANLVAYWKFEQNTLDSTINHNDGTITGISSWAKGVTGNSISLSGTNNYVTCPDSATLNIQGDITVEAWIKTSATQDEEILAKYQGSNGGCNGYALKIQNGKLSFLVGTNWKLSIGSVNDGNWHYVVATGNGNTGFFYIDGQPSGTFNYSTVTNNASIPLYIGCYQGCGCFTGNLDEMAIWNRALTQAEIQIRYNTYNNPQPKVYTAGVICNTACYWINTDRTDNQGIARNGTEGFQRRKA